MTLTLELPPDVDAKLQIDAERRGIAKESLVIDLISRSIADSVRSDERVPEDTLESDFWSPPSFESLARLQVVEPISDFRRWLASLPNVEGADDLADRIEEARRERRELERRSA